MGRCSILLSVLLLSGVACARGGKGRRPAARGAAATDRTARTLAERLAANPALVDAAKGAPDLLVRLAYSTRDNFLKKDVYGDLERCYLAKPAAKKLARATKLLKKLRPELRLLAYDCVRPVQVQRAMWKLVKGTRAQPYVANPAKGSVHNFGCAVDLTVADARGKPLDMGTPFDHAGKASQPRYEREHLLAGKLTLLQWSNRLLLRYVMVQAGFIPLDIEWWHFDCMKPDEARRKLVKVR